MENGVKKRRKKGENNENEEKRQMHAGSASAAPGSISKTSSAASSVAYQRLQRNSGQLWRHGGVAAARFAREIPNAPRAARSLWLFSGLSNVLKL